MKEKLSKENIESLVKYRLERADETIQEAVYLLEKDFYNASINRLYYACYYAVSALLVKNEIQAHTHAGTKQMLGMHFVVTGKLSRSYNVIYNDLFDKRHSGDYDDFLCFDRETVERLLPEAKNFVETIKSIVKTDST